MIADIERNIHYQDTLFTLTSTGQAMPGQSRSNFVTAASVRGSIYQCDVSLVIGLS